MRRRCATDIRTNRFKVLLTESNRRSRQATCCRNDPRQMRPQHLPRQRAARPSVSRYPMRWRPPPMMPPFRQARSRPTLEPPAASSSAPRSGADQSSATSKRSPGDVPSVPPKFSVIALDRPLRPPARRADRRSGWRSSHPPVDSRSACLQAGQCAGRSAVDR